MEHWNWQRYHSHSAIEHDPEAVEFKCDRGPDWIGKSCRLSGLFHSPYSGKAQTTAKFVRDELSNLTQTLVESCPRRIRY